MGRWRLPSLADFEAGSMNPDELSELAAHLRQLAVHLEEIRFLHLEAALDWRERIPNRPTIGYYIRLRRKTA